MIYLKKFENHAEYTAYTASTEFVKPNVSHCIQEVEVHYNPFVETRLVATFNVENDSEETLIYGTMECCDVSVLERFSKIEVDGVEVSLADLDENYGYYQLSEGIHNVKYTLLDSTEIGSSAFYTCYALTSINIPSSVTNIGNNAFYGCSITDIDIPSGVTSIGDYTFRSCRSLTSCTIGNSVTSIGTDAFGSCSSLTSINIPSGVTSIGNDAFQGCTSLSSITSNATTAPTIQSSTFRDVKTNGTLYVLQGSIGYDTWMGTGDYYLGKYNWTKVEQ